MNNDQLREEIKKELEVLGKRDEVFVIIVDAINQVKITLLFSYKSSGLLTELSVKRFRFRFKTYFLLHFTH